jgi:hypothetical protein
MPELGVHPQSFIPAKGLIFFPVPLLLCRVVLGSANGAGLQVVVPQPKMFP